MSTLHSSALPRSFAAFFSPVLRRFTDEAVALLDAFMNPNRIVAEVEQMRALQNQADAIEATDPVRATALRQRAARIGLR